MGQAPEMNSEAPQGEAPADKGNSQAPETNSQAPQMGENGQPPRMKGKGPKDGFGFIEFKDYVEDGTISQDTYDAITKYMEENKPDLLKDLLEAGVITQEEYDTLAAAREANKPAAPAANQNNESTQTTDESAGA